MLNIRKYADEMLDSLDDLERWPDIVKEQQRGWIGRQRGYEVQLETQDGQSLWVFTTDVSQLHDASYIAVSPESTKIIAKLT